MIQPVVVFVVVVVTLFLPMNRAFTTIATETESDVNTTALVGSAAVAYGVAVALVWSSVPVSDMTTATLSAELVLLGVALAVYGMLLGSFLCINAYFYIHPAIER